MANNGIMLCLILGECTAMPLNSNRKILYNLHKKGNVEGKVRSLTVIKMQYGA